MEYKNTGRARNGKVVHALITISQPICGTGQVSIGTRKSTRCVITNEPITCKRCLDKLTAQKNED